MQEWDNVSFMKHRFLNRWVAFVPVFVFWPGLGNVSEAEQPGSVAPAAASQPAGQPTVQRPLRIAFYNIEFFNEQLDPRRLAKLKSIVGKIDADIWGLSEISSRAALEKLFDPKEYEIMILDSPRENQEVALAVKKPLRLADPAPRMIFPGPKYDGAFPGARDLLNGMVILPSGQRVLCYVAHAKSRYGGRVKSEERRREHSREFVKYLKANYKLTDTAIVLLGDLNDTPDDASLNILETGDPNAPAAQENEPDTFLIDLGEPLWVRDMATEGLNLDHVGPDGKIKLQAAGNRQRNWDTLNEPDDPARWRPIMFDIILVSPWLAKRLDSAGMRIYDQPDALGPSQPLDQESKDPTRASDHLPIFADFNLN